MIQLRKATPSDIPILEQLIPCSARSLQAGLYSSAQTEGALGTIFAVDRQLIEDGTYFVAESDGVIIACGGWSFRGTLCGGDSAKELRENTRLNPETDRARIRAFFVHPAWSRKGIGTLLLTACEKALLQAGFRRAEILATLTGELLYLRFGYHVASRYNLALANGEQLPVVQLLKDFILPE